MLMRDAATVILLRDATGHSTGHSTGDSTGHAAGDSAGDAAGIEIYLQRRVRGMAFAAGMWVFPGGTVDPRDAETPVPRLQDWPRRLHADPPLAAALISTAIRETFEETGVLVATTARPDACWESDRLALIGHDSALADVLRRRDATVRAETLRTWSHWVTPEGEPRRYDTRFFLAALPDGQNPREVGGEVQEAMWMRPDRTNELPMLPPTRVTLAELAGYDSVAAVMAAAADRVPEPILPVRRGGSVELPDGTVI